MRELIPLVIVFGNYQLELLIKELWGRRWLLAGADPGVHKIIGDHETDHHLSTIQRSVAICSFEPKAGKVGRIDANDIHT